MEFSTSTDINKQGNNIESPFDPTEARVKIRESSEESDQFSDYSVKIEECKLEIVSPSLIPNGSFKKVKRNRKQNNLENDKNVKSKVNQMKHEHKETTVINDFDRTMQNAFGLPAEGTDFKRNIEFYNFEFEEMHIKKKKIKHKNKEQHIENIFDDTGDNGRNECLDVDKDSNVFSTSDFGMPKKKKKKKRNEETEFEEMHVKKKKIKHKNKEQHIENIFDDTGDNGRNECLDVDKDSNVFSTSDFGMPKKKKKKKRNEETQTIDNISDDTGVNRLDEDSKVIITDNSERGSIKKKKKKHNNSENYIHVETNGDLQYNTNESPDIKFRKVKHKENLVISDFDHTTQNAFKLPETSGVKRKIDFDTCKFEEMHKKKKKTHKNREQRIANISDDNGLDETSKVITIDDSERGFIKKKKVKSLRTEDKINGDGHFNPRNGSSKTVALINHSLENPQNPVGKEKRNKSQIKIGSHLKNSKARIEHSQELSNIEANSESNIRDSDVSVMKNKKKNSTFVCHLNGNTPGKEGNEQPTAGKSRSKNLKRLKIDALNHIPPLHGILISSTHVTKDQLRLISSLNITIKKGNFSKKEDAKIKRNWTNFIKEYSLPDKPELFFSFIKDGKGIITRENTIHFKQFLSQDLNDRTINSVYDRFKRIFNMSLLKKGRFTPEEDNVILKHLKKSGTRNINTKLGKILHRTALSVQKRIALLKHDVNQEEIRWNSANMENFLRRLMKVTKCSDYKKLKDRDITDEEWVEMEKKLKYPVKRLKRGWYETMYPRFFIKDIIDFNVVCTSLIKRMYKNKEDDWRTVDWKQYAKLYDGLTYQKLYRLFRNLTRVYVTTTKQQDLGACISQLLNAEFRFRTKQLKRLELRNGKIIHINRPTRRNENKDKKMKEDPS